MPKAATISKEQNMRPEKTEKQDDSRESSGIVIPMPKPVVCTGFKRPA